MAVTHDNTPDASAQAVRMSLQQWIRIELGKGHPARLVRDVIEQEAEIIRRERETP